MDKVELVNHPAHYTQYPVEVIDMMVAIWGSEKVAEYCTLNAFKYRMRAGHKGDVEQDLAKESWYLNKARCLLAESTPKIDIEGCIQYPCDVFIRNRDMI